MYKLTVLSIDDVFLQPFPLGINSMEVLTFSLKVFSLFPFLRICLNHDIIIESSDACYI